MASTRDRAVFCHKMYNALHAGFDTERALMIMQEEKRSDIRSALVRTLEGVQKGKPLSSAMRPDELVYSPELVNAVYVSEQTGHTELAFKRMADRFDAQETTRRKLRQAALYPTIVLIVFMVCLLIVASVWNFLPEALIFEFSLVGIIAVALFLGYGGQELSRRDMIIGNVAIKLPFIGKLIMKSEMADFASNMSVFYASGVSLDKGLEYSARSIRYKVLRDKVLRSIVWVQKGCPLSEALQLQEIFPADLIHMLRTGEASGNADGMLEQIATYYRQDVQHRLDILFAALRF